jgi:hypothetical protein
LVNSNVIFNCKFKFNFLKNGYIVEETTHVQAEYLHLQNKHPTARTSAHDVTASRSGICIKTNK